jgi:hypothetical protein
MQLPLKMLGETRQESSKHLENTNSSLFNLEKIKFAQ